MLKLCISGHFVRKIPTLRKGTAVALVLVLSFMFLKCRTWMYRKSGNTSTLFPNHQPLDRDMRLELTRLLAMHSWKGVSGSEKEQANETLMVKTSNEFCAKWAKELVWSNPSHSPLINLDPNRLIYPANQNGPSNELIAFQEAIFVGIVTNRTIVVPRFMPHRQDRDGKDAGPISAAMRVDLDILSRFVSLKTVDEMQNLCYSRFDVGFQHKKASCAYQHYVKVTTNMSLRSEYQETFGGNDFGNMRMKYKKASSCEVPGLPVRHTPLGGKVKPESVRNIYNSSFPCAVMINTYGSLMKSGQKVDDHLLDYARNDLTSLVPTNINGASGDTVLKLIEIFMQRPRYVRELATEFTSEVMRGGNYVAMHWRYNDEWIACKSGNNTKFNFCGKLSSVTPGDLARGVILLAKNLTQWLSHGESDTQFDCTTVNAYFATATDDHEIIKYKVNDRKFREEFMIKALKRNGKADQQQVHPDSKCWNVRIFTKIDLFHFIERKHPREKCSSIWRDAHELIALVENELCRRSTVFGYCPGSSWSDVALQTRKNTFDFLSNISVWDVLSEVKNITGE